MRLMVTEPRHEPCIRDLVAFELLAVPLAFVSPWISYALWVLVALMWFVPDRRFAR